MTDRLRSDLARSMLARDSLVAAVLAVPAFLPALAQVGIVVGDLPERPLDAVGVLIEALLWFPLAARRARPAVTLGVVGAAFAAHELLGYPPSATTLGLYVALYSAGAHLARHRRGVAVAGTLASGVLAAALIGLGSPNGPGVFAVGYLALAFCWQAGAWVRNRQLEADERRRLSVQAAIQAEQARIARELHDVVTHHVTAMVVQADAAQFVAGAGPEPVVAGLASIGDTGRRALGDLRHLLGVLSATHDSDPPLAPAGSIGDLVEQTRRTGQPVELTETGRRKLSSSPSNGLSGSGPSSNGPSSGELAVYRVVQEGLTNALKHAPGAATRVRLDHGAAATEVEVTTAGGLPGAGIEGSGLGLVGLRQRIEMVQGELVTGTTADGGFRVWARIPVP